MSKIISSLLKKLKITEQRSDFGPVTEVKIRLWLVNRLASLAKIDPRDVDTTRPFESYGLDSLAAVEVSGDLEKILERRLSPALLFEHPNIDSLSKYITTEFAQSDEITS